MTPAAAPDPDRPLEVPLVAGVLGFVLAETLRRLLTSFGVDAPRDAIEGTWVFLVGDIALVGLLAYRLVTIPRRGAPEGRANGINPRRMSRDRAA